MGSESKQRDLILAAVEDYDWEPMRAFVESLEATRFDGEVRFFVWNVTAETEQTLREHGVEITHVRRLRFRIRGTLWHPYNWKTNRLRWHGQPFWGRIVRGIAALSPNRRRTTARLVGGLGNLPLARYCWYFNYLSETVARYRNVMLTDVRDVFFLGSPFEFQIGASLHVFLEDDTIGSHIPSRAWLLGAFGEETLAELSDRRVVCSGTTIGAAPAMLEYLGVMVDELARLDRQFDGMDQGVHNFVVHTGLVANVVEHGNEDGPIVTVATVTGEEARRLVFERAEPPRVVHQHDRHPQVRDELEGRLGARSDAASQANQGV